MVKVAFIHADGHEWIGKILDPHPTDPRGQKGPETDVLPKYIDLGEPLTARGMEATRDRPTNRFYLDKSTEDHLVPVYRESIS